MAIYRIVGENAKALEKTTFLAEHILERQGLQKMFRKSIDILVPNVMVLAEEFGDWEDSLRRIDLLCLDRDARLIVVELKRTEDGGHMELQAVRYAAMVSHMTFAAAVRAHKSFLKTNNIEGDAEEIILGFLRWDEPKEEIFAAEVAIVLASPEFSREITSTVIWLSEHDIDIRCVKIEPYKFEQEILLDIQQIVPPPEASDYQVRWREKEREERRARTQNRDITRFHLSISDKTHDNLPKRRLAYLIIREAINRGAKPLDVYPIGRRWLIVSGELDEDSFLTAAEKERDAESSASESSRFYTAGDELFKADGKTYALTSMWGNQTLSEVDRIVDQFNLNDVSYRPMDRKN